MARYRCTVKMKDKNGNEKYATVTVTADMDLAAMKLAENKALTQTPSCVSASCIKMIRSDVLARHVIFGVD